MQFITTVARPVLTPEEREKRMAAIEAAAANLLISAERHRLEKERKP